MSITTKKVLKSVRSDADRLNLKSLQKIDPTITNILYTSKHTVLYVLKEIETKEWQKADTEGPCFLVERKNKNKKDYSIILMNRNNPVNFIQDLCGRPLIMEYQTNYIFIKRKESNFIFGLWFYSQQACHEYYNEMLLLQNELVNIQFKTLLKKKSKKKMKQNNIKQPPPTNYGQFKQQLQDLMENNHEFMNKYYQYYKHHSNNQSISLTEFLLR